MQLLRGLLIGSLSTALVFAGDGIATSEPNPLDAERIGPASLTTPRSGSTSAADLLRLNPNPELLDVPQTESEVQIDVSKPITLEQAIELAKRNNRDLQITELELERRRQELAETRAALYPTLSAQGSLVRTDSATRRIANESIPPALRSSTVTNLFNASVQLNYDVFTTGQRDGSIKAAKSAVEAAEKALETEIQTLRLDVSADYFDLQAADSLVEIAQSSVTQSEISLRDAQALERAGLGTRFDVLTAEVQLANNQQQLTQALSQQDIARRALAERLSLNQTATLSAADPVAVIGQWQLSLENSILLAQQNRSELGEVSAQAEIARQNRRIALGSLGPQINITAAGTVADVVDDAFSASFGSSQGVQIANNIFDGGAARAIASQQRLNEQIANTQFADFKNTIRFQVEQNFFTLNSSFENIQTNLRAVDQAEESLRLARLRFQAGIGTQQDVITAERDLTTARSNLLQAVIDYNQALVGLRRAVGSRILNP